MDNKDCEIDDLTLDTTARKKEAAPAESASTACGTNADLLPQRDVLVYPPRYPDYHRVSWSEATKPSNQIEMDKPDFRWADVHDDDCRSLDGFFDAPRCRGVVEWLMCLIFDVLLLVVEVGISLWLASSLFEQDWTTQYRAIPIALILPSVFNSVTWLGIRSSYPAVSTVFILILVLIGFPSPLFVYIWHLYLAMFAKHSDAVRSKHLANTFRVVQAITCSVPIVLINIITLIHVFRVPGREHHEMDLDRLSDHLAEVKMHGLAFFISIANIVRAFCLFNERQTFTLLFVLVGCPFILLTVLSRIVSLGIIVAFVDQKWTAILLLGLTFVNILLYCICRKRGNTVLAMPNKKGSKHRISKRTRSNFLSPIRAGSPDDVASNTDCTNSNCIEVDCRCCSGMQLRNRSYSYTIDSDCKSVGQGQAESACGKFIRMTFLSVCSIVAPCSYTNDRSYNHPRLKGGLFLLLNYVATSVILGVPLGYAIIHLVPNTIRGVAIPQPSLKVQIPRSKVVIEAGGLDVSLDLPDTKMDLGSMPTFSATINTDSNDYAFGVGAPILLAALVLPFVVMRALMMELDCFVTRRKLLNVVDVETYAYKRHKLKKKAESSSTSSGSNAGGVENVSKVTLVDTVTNNIDNQELKFRMFTALVCGVLGMIVMVVFFMLLGAFIYMNLH